MLGVGLDMPWGAGFQPHPEGDRVGPHIRRFLDSNADTFGHLFLSWQPRSRARLDLDDYVQGWDFLQDLDGYPVRGLHHTALNLASSEGYDRTELLEFTNALIERYQLAWVNEDLGFWSLRGRPLPYPLPPLLTDDGLAACVRNVREVDLALAAPLRVEFPGFSAGWSLSVGEIDAYDFFNRVVRDSGAACTLDVGHLLSWRWLQGHRGEALLDGLERLPLDHTVELHLSGVAIEGDAFIDAHHGVLVEPQYALLERLLQCCPNLQQVTFEDPVPQADGTLAPDNQRSLDRLVAMMRGTISAPSTRQPGASTLTAPRLPAVREHEDRLDRAFRGLGYVGLPSDQVEGIARQLRKMTLARKALGIPTLRARFAPVFEGVDPDALMSEFAASEVYDRWVELPGRTPDLCLEEAFSRFLAGRVNPALLAELRCKALVRALGVDPDPAFVVPEDVLGEPHRWILLRETPSGTFLHAAVHGRIVEGALPASAVACIRAAEGVGPPISETLVPVRQKLIDLQVLSNVTLDRPRV